MKILIPDQNKISKGEKTQKCEGLTYKLKNQY